MLNLPVPLGGLAKDRFYLCNGVLFSTDFNVIRSPIILNLRTSSTFRFALVIHISQSAEIGCDSICAVNNIQKSGLSESLSKVSPQNTLVLLNHGTILQNSECLYQNSSIYPSSYPPSFNSVMTYQLIMLATELLLIR